MTNGSIPSDYRYESVNDDLPHQHESCGDISEEMTFPMATESTESNLTSINTVVYRLVLNGSILLLHNYFAVLRSYKLA